MQIQINKYIISIIFILSIIFSLNIITITANNSISKNTNTISDFIYFNNYIKQEYENKITKNILFQYIKPEQRGIFNKKYLIIKETDKGYNNIKHTIEETVGKVDRINIIYNDFKFSNCVVFAKTSNRLLNIEKDIESYEKRKKCLQKELTILPQTLNIIYRTNTNYVVITDTRDNKISKKTEGLLIKKIEDEPIINKNFINKYKQVNIIENKSKAQLKKRLANNEIKKILTKIEKSKIYTSEDILKKFDINVKIIELSKNNIEKCNIRKYYYNKTINKYIDSEVKQNISPKEYLNFISDKKNKINIKCIKDLYKFNKEGIYIYIPKINSNLGMAKIPIIIDYNISQGKYITPSEIFMIYKKTTRNSSLISKIYTFIYDKFRIRYRNIKYKKDIDLLSTDKDKINKLSSGINLKKGMYFSIYKPNIANYNDYKILYLENNNVKIERTPFRTLILFIFSFFILYGLIEGIINYIKYLKK